MITALVQIKLPAPARREEVVAAFEASAPNYRGTPGLLRKYYLFDGVDRVGGFYLWRDRESAAAVHTPAWLKQVGERYGSIADISYFEVPVVVDNGAEQDQDKGTD
ncbi:MAG: hypothetical protein HQ483_05160 [Rhodospirillales bacterium]|nr:hypothetical protein [Rhodospirillales bacterium]